VPKRKKRKTKTEKTMENALETFMKFQTEAEERFQLKEEERWQREQAIEEQRRKEDHEHDLQMMQMIGQILQPRTYQANPYSYEYDSQY
jgi:hypothetical protein